jgi:hypothetical protein
LQSRVEDAGDPASARPVSGGSPSREAALFAEGSRRAAGDRRRSSQKRFSTGSQTSFEMDAWEPSLLAKLLGLDDSPAEDGAHADDRTAQLGPDGAVDSHAADADDERSGS